MTWTTIKMFAAIVLLTLLAGGTDVGICSMQTASAQTPASQPAATQAALTEAQSDKAPTGDKLVEFLVHQNELSYQAIHSISYRFEGAVEDDEAGGEDGLFVDRFTGEAVRDSKGRCRASLNVKVKDEYEGKPAKVSRMETRWVINDNYAAKWEAIVPHTPACMYDHKSIASMSPGKFKEFQEDTGDDFILCGYGDGLNPLRSHLLNPHAGSTRWEAAEVHNAGILAYQLKTYFKGSSGEDILENCWDIDPNEGFIITRFRHYREGIVVNQRTITAEKRGDIWIPVAIAQTEYKDSRTDTNYKHSRIVPEENGGHLDGALGILSRTRTKLKGIEINQPIDPDEFTLGAIGLPNRSFVVRYAIDGKHSLWRFVDGSLLPYSVSMELDRAGN